MLIKRLYRPKYKLAWLIFWVFSINCRPVPVPRLPATTPASGTSCISRTSPSFVRVYSKFIFINIIINVINTAS